MKFSSKKICIFDLDGVLYYNGVYNKLNVDFCNERSIIFCTGRGLKRANVIISKISPQKFDYTIINNGATIIKNSKVIYEASIKMKELKRVLNDISNLKSIAFINIITSNKNGYQYFDPNNLINDYEYYECNEKFDNFYNFKNYCINNHVVKLTIVFKKIDSEIFKKLHNLGFMKSDKNMFCLVSSKVDKLTAIKKVAKLEQYKLKDIIYFGNDYNDYCVFKNKKITSVYVYDSITDNYLKNKCDYNVSFDNLSNFLNEEVDKI